MEDKTAAQQISHIVESQEEWKRQLLLSIREVIISSDDKVVEEVKWKTPSRPEGLPVWSYKGIVCISEIWKDNIKLIFVKGVELKDLDGLFNARLKSRTDRAIEFKEGDKVSKDSLKSLVQEAVALNEKRAKSNL